MLLWNPTPQANARGLREAGTGRPWRARQVGLTLAILGCLVVAAGCGGGSPSENIEAPLVRAFSPFLSPFDFDTFQQNPTFTNGLLTEGVDPNYPGKIVVYFQADTQLDPSSIFTAGDPNLGLDLSALGVFQFVPGSGNVELPMSNVQVESDRIILTPASLPLPNGQYSIAVLRVKNVDGDDLREGPVFHSFTVGAMDTVAPFVVATDPVNNEIGIGAGVAPPLPPSGPTEGVADVRTNIFGDTSPDVTIRFNEGIDASTVSLSNVQVINAGSPLIPPPQIAAAPGFPRLKSVADGATLPSNGHEIVWRPDPLLGGFPFGTIIQVTVTGFDEVGGMPTNPTPVADLAGNGMEASYVFQFQTIAPPDLPQNPQPEWAIWWSASDRVGTIDVPNQQGLADQFTGAQSFPFGVPRNVTPQFTDTVATAQNVPGFEPTEISVDGRVNGGTCHTWIYAMSSNSGEIVVINSRTSIPVAIIQTTNPGGISNQTGGGQAANVLTVTNQSANTLTIFDIASVTPGTGFINGPIFIQAVRPTGNTPRAVSISLPATGNWSRDPNLGGPATPLIMYADFTDGVVNTTTLSSTEPVSQFSLGPNSSPNDVNMTGCFGLNPILFAAISQGGLPGEGKVSYYIAGPGCQTGTATGARPDNIVGQVDGLDGPAGLDQIFPMGNGALFALAQSGSQANSVAILGTETGAGNLPRIVREITQVGANPVAVAHPSAWLQPPCIDFIDPIVLCSPNPSCWYNNTEQNKTFPDLSLATAQDLYICARGAGQITVVNLVTALRDKDSPVLIPGVRFVATIATQ